MFASLAAFVLAAQQIVVPFGNPKQIERLPAPLASAGPEWVAACGGSDDWDKPAPPVRIHGNSYLVGTCGIAAILVTGDKGHVLIDGGTEAGAEVIAANIRALGFRVEDVRILLHSHEHIDHVGGTARLQQFSGAQLYASAPAAAVFKTGAPARDDPQVGLFPPFPAARVDQIIAGGQEVRLGNLMLTAIATPGHTAGALSWRWVACEGGVCPTIVYADSLSPVSRDDYRFSDHPTVVADFRASFARIADGRCDILLTPHPGSSAMPDRLALKAPMRNPDACRDYAAAKAKSLDERLDREAAKK